MNITDVAPKWRSWAPQILGIFRIVAAAIFITSGTTKMFGWPAGMPEGFEFEIMSQIGLAAVLEIGGGTLMLLGLWTRPVAFVLSGMMAVAYFQGHAPQSLWPTVNMGIPAIMYCFFWLYLSAAGPGALSIDSLRSKAA
jgi:putative oxidoreductase